MKNKIKLYIVILAALAFPAFAEAQFLASYTNSNNTMIRLKGIDNVSPLKDLSTGVEGILTSRETGKPIEKASIEIEGTEGNDITDAKGHFKIVDVTDGNVVLSVNMAGKLSQYFYVLVISGYITSFDTKL